MRTLDANRTAAQWLTAVGEPPASVATILKTFASAPKVFVYQAPHLFLRAHGRGCKKPIFAPNFWADGSALGSALDRASQFQAFLSDEEISSIAKVHYREITAISYPWNDMASDSFWRINLCGSESIEGIEGLAASQPTHVADTRTGAPASKSILKGGGIQVFLNPQTPFICTPVSW